MCASRCVIDVAHGPVSYDVPMLRPVLMTLVLLASGGVAAFAQTSVPVWDLQEIELRSARSYANPYVDVECWVDLQGPGFANRVYGFWDGDRTFRVRVVATTPGDWTWRSGSNQPDDAGLNGATGRFTAREWTEEEKRQNPNRRGFLRPDPGGHALQYADGTPFFLLGDTWLGAVTWRLAADGRRRRPRLRRRPRRDLRAGGRPAQAAGVQLGQHDRGVPDVGSDQYPGTYADKKGVYYRNAWEMFGVTVPGGSADGQVDARRARPSTVRDRARQRGARRLRPDRARSSSGASTGRCGTSATRASSRCSRPSVGTSRRRGRRTTTSTCRSGDSCSTWSRATARST